MKNIIPFLFLTILLIGCSDNLINNPVVEQDKLKTNSFILDLRIIDISNQTYSYNVINLDYENYVLDVPRKSFPIENIREFHLSYPEYFSITIVDIYNVNHVHLIKGVDFQDSIFHLIIKGCGISYLLKDVISFHINQ